jgi:hypothetical protein
MFVFFIRTVRTFSPLQVRVLGEKYTLEDEEDMKKEVISKMFIG